MWKNILVKSFFVGVSFLAYTQTSEAGEMQLSGNISYGNRNYLGNMGFSYLNAPFSMYGGYYGGGCWNACLPQVCCNPCYVNYYNPCLTNYRYMPTAFNQRRGWNINAGFSYHN